MEYLDPVRKKAVRATPEEAVRQKIVSWLLETVKVPKHLIEVEFGLGRLQKGNPDRVDILVHHFRAGASVREPWLLVECKRPLQFTLQDLEVQVNKYLRVLKPSYIMLGLGDDWRFLKLDSAGRGYVQVSGLPAYPGTPC